MFGNGLTFDEMDYWQAYNIISQCKMYKIPLDGIDLDTAIEKIKTAIESSKKPRGKQK